MIDTLEIAINSKYISCDVHQLNKAKTTLGSGWSHGSIALSYQDDMKKKNIYAPNFKLTDYHGVDKSKKTVEQYKLKITVSAPKLVYGTNLYELGIQDFGIFRSELLRHLRQAGFSCEDDVLRHGVIERVDFSKNLKLPNWAGVAGQVLKLLSEFNYKRSSDFNYYKSNTHVGKDGDWIKFYNKTQGYCAYDKYSEIQNKGFTKAEQEIIKDIKSGTQRKDILRFEFSLQNSVSVKSFLGSRLRKKEIKLEDVFNEELSRKVLLEIYAQIYGKGFSIIIDYSKKMENIFERLLKRSGYSLDNVARLLYMRKKVAEIGLAQTLVELRLGYGKDKVRRLRELVKSLPKKAKIDEPCQVNIIDFLKEELEKFHIIKPNSK